MIGRDSEMTPNIYSCLNAMPEQLRFRDKPAPYSKKRQRLYKDVLQKTKKIDGPTTFFCCGKTVPWLKGLYLECFHAVIDDELLNLEKKQTPKSAYNIIHIVLAASKGSAEYLQLILIQFEVTTAF